MSTTNIFMPHFTVDNYGIFIFLNQELVELMSVSLAVLLEMECFCSSHSPQNSGQCFQVLASMLPNRVVESCHGCTFLCPHAGYSLVCVCCQIRPSTSYWLWPVMQGVGSCYHVCLSTETARSSAVIVLLLQLPPRCLVPLVPPVPYFIYYMSWCQKIESWLFFFNSLAPILTSELGLAHCECRASLQLCGGGLLDRACKVGHLVLHLCARRANWRVDFQKQFHSL